MTVREQYINETGNAIPMFQDEIIELQRKYAFWLEDKIGVGSALCSPFDRYYVDFLERKAKECDERIA